MLMREVVMMPDDEVEAIRSQPSWPARVAAVHTVPRELRGLLTVPFDPTTAAKISVPTLMLIGSDSPDPAAAEVEIVAGAMPNARIEVLDGQQHVADVLAPDVFAEHVIAFLDRGTDGS
jgi:pimeloyl-ACP methyl ester carboxylesterase